MPKKDTKTKKELTKEILADITELLSREREEIEAKLGLHQNREAEDNADVDANVQAIVKTTVEASLKETLEKQLRDIKKALDRIEKGVYGVCKYCDNDIKPGRLKIRPTSGSCVECKKALTDEA